MRHHQSVLVTAALAVACQMISGVDELEVVETDSESGGSGGASAGSSGESAGHAGEGGNDATGGGGGSPAAGAGGGSSGTSGSAATGGNSGTGGCDVVSCFFPSACRDCLDGMAGTTAGGVDCARVVEACGRNEAEHCTQTLSCIVDELNNGATRDCAVGTCVSDTNEPEAEEFFLCQAAYCGEICEVSEGFPCP